MRYLVSRGAGSIALMLAAAAMPLAAQDAAGSAGSSARGADVAVALRLSTLGVGLEVGKWLVPHLSVRVGANTGKFNKDGQEKTDITYDIHLKLKAVEVPPPPSPHLRPRLRHWATRNGAVATAGVRRVARAALG